MVHVVGQVVGGRRNQGSVMVAPCVPGTAQLQLDVGGDRVVGGQRLAPVHRAPGPQGQRVDGNKVSTIFTVGICHHSS